MTKGVTTIGVVSEGINYATSNIIVQLTSDSFGETLSFTSDQGIMIAVDYELIEKLVKEVRNDRESKI